MVEIEVIMGIQEDVLKMENEMFNTLTVGFYCLQHKDAKKLKFCLVALNELDKEYIKVTKKPFINQDSLKRLQDGLKALSGKPSTTVAK